MGDDEEVHSEETTNKNNDYYCRDVDSSPGQEDPGLQEERARESGSSGRGMPKDGLPGKVLALTFVPGGAVGGNVTGADDLEEPVTREEGKKSTRAMVIVSKTRARQKGSVKTPTVAKKKEYKQGLRRMKQEIETGVQPRIFKFLADHGEEPVHGGQPPQTG